MAKNLKTQKVIRVSEESSPPMHIPLIVGNEIFVLTQQDIRRVEDVRLLTYNRLSAQVDLLTGSPHVGFPDSWRADVHPLVPPPVDLLAPPIVDPLGTPAVDLEKQFPNLFPHYCREKAVPESLVRFLNDDLEPGPTRTVASVATQLGAKYVQTSSPFPLHYSVGTSTCGLTTPRSASGQLPPRKEWHNTSCQTDATTKCVGCNTDAFSLKNQDDSIPQKCVHFINEYPMSNCCSCCSSLTEKNEENDLSSFHGNRYSQRKVRISDKPPIFLPNSNYPGQQN